MKQNKIEIIEKGIVTVRAESPEGKIRNIARGYNEITPRGKLECLFNIINASSNEWDMWNVPEREAFAEINDDTIYFGDILENQTESYDYGQNVSNYNCISSLILANKADENIYNSELDADSITHVREQTINVNEDNVKEELPETDILKITKSWYIISSSVSWNDLDDEDEKEFNVIAIGDANGDIVSIYSFLDETFTLAGYENLYIDWEQEFVLPDVP